jgi:hypothetical protein
MRVADLREIDKALNRNAKAPQYDDLRRLSPRELRSRVSVIQGIYATPLPMPNGAVFRGLSDWQHTRTGQALNYLANESAQFQGPQDCRVRICGDQFGCIAWKGRTLHLH